MENTNYGQGFLASLFDELGRWGHLAGQFFEANHNTFAVVSILLMALVSVAVLFYLLPRSRIGRTLGVTLAVAAGVALIGQALLAVSVPKLYENYGRGRVASCPILERDADGNLIYEPHKVEIDGEQRTAMIARKIVYQVEANPVAGHTDDRETVGLLLTNPNAGQAFPVFCGIALDEEGEKLLLALQAAQRPVPVDVIVEALLMEEGGFAAYEALWSYDGSDENPGVRLFVAHLASKLKVEDILPLTPEDLLFVMNEAEESATKGFPVSAASTLASAYKMALEPYGINDRHSYLLVNLFQRKLGNGDVVAEALNNRYQLERFIDDSVLSVAAEAGLNRAQLLEALERAVKITNRAYSNVYAQEVRKVLENASLETRKPLIVLPGKAPWYLIDTNDQQGQNGQEGQEGEGEPQEGEGESSQETEDAVSQAQRQGEQNRINNERFGKKSDNSSSSGGRKRDDDRS